MENPSEQVLTDDYEHVEENVLYTPVNVQGRGVDARAFEEQFEGCQCHLSCRIDCQCLVRCGSSAYNEGLLDVDKYRSTTMMIYECHEKCQCFTTCSNVLVQKGPHPQLQVFATPLKGWGLRATVDLRKGMFVCEYAGEIISPEEARIRFTDRRPGQRNFILVLREFFGSSGMVMTLIDPTSVGNIGRYINHSCQPNLVMVPVRTDTIVPKLCLFTNQDVPANVELSFDYSGNREDEIEGTGRNDAPGTSPCYCGAALCRGTLPFDSSLSG